MVDYVLLRLKEIRSGKSESLLSVDLLASLVMIKSSSFLFRQQAYTPKSECILANLSVTLEVVTSCYKFASS